MRQSSLWLMALLAMPAISSVSAQSIGDRLKKVIKVETKKPASAGARRADQNKDTVKKAELALPATSKAAPEILGLKGGVSTTDDVRALLSSPTLALELTENRAQLQGRSSSSRAEIIPVPNATYVNEMRAVTKGRAYNGMDRSGDCYGDESCQTFAVRFTAPPASGVMYYLSRMVKLKDGPSVDAAAKGVVDKYGPASFQSAYQDVTYSYVWAWSVEGAPVKLSADHLCVRERGLVNVPQEQVALARQMLQAGCAAIVRVEINQKNTVVRSITTTMIVPFTSYTAGIKTNELVAARVAAFEQCERDRAAKTGVSAEFGDVVPPVRSGTGTGAKAGSDSSSGRGTRGGAPPKCE